MFLRFKVGCCVRWTFSTLYATIANFQWFSKFPSPLNGMVEGNHWDRWFSDGFGVRQPLVKMVFDGCAPLVRRWNGYVPSSKSNPLPARSPLCHHQPPAERGRLCRNEIQHYLQ